jgi:adenine-specific DNA-methyltransferase
MSDEIEKLKMHSPDLTQDNIAKIRALFPGCVTEAAGEDGKLRLAVDFDQLRQELSDSIVEGPQERYHLNWPGKREALITANAPIAKTLRPCRDESVDFDTTQNLFIEGDNLEALKLLQETYLGKVKVIFIDPPYNTGHDFIYDDDFAADKAEFLEKSGQETEERLRLVANLESNGRFHSDWMSMIFSRLKLARNLMSDDGVVFITIDDGEQANLRKVCDEVFGETNFFANIVWRSKDTAGNDSSGISAVHNHVLVYRKSDAFKASLFPRNEDQLANYKNPDNDERGPWLAVPLTRGEFRERDSYPLTNPAGVEVMPPPGNSWRRPKDEIERLAADNRIWWGKSGDSTFPSIKTFLSEVKDGVTPTTWWDYKFAGSTRRARAEIKALFEGTRGFDTPKPLDLIDKILQLSSPADEESIVMDFFAGSATFGHGVMLKNAQDSGKRKVVLVQIPEELDAEAEFSTIAEISKERIRRAGQKILEGECHPDWNKDVGFRVLKIDSSNMADVFYTPDQTSQADLLARVDNIKPDRTAEDLLFQVLLDWGVDLTLPIRRETVQGKTVFFVADTALMACFDDGISEDLVKELADQAPMRIVFKDTGFADDQTKINVRQIFKAMSPETEVKAI